MNDLRQLAFDHLRAMLPMSVSDWDVAMAAYALIEKGWHQ